MQHKVHPDQVKIGMYIQAFGGSWFDHPFWKPRFILRTQRDVDRVRRSGVPYVLIDDTLGIAPEAERIASTRSSAGAGRSHAFKPKKYRSSRNEPEDAAPSDQNQVQLLVKRWLSVTRRVFDDARLGRAVVLDEVIPVVTEINRCIERAPRTLLAVIRLKKKDEYTYFHSVAVCTLMVNLACHMGKSEEEVREYGLAGLLHDIGKMSIPEDVLNKPGRLTESEFALVRSHPANGYAMLLGTPDVGASALDVCRHHHEKIDGSGYPFGLAGEAFSTAARLGAICDVYDALTSERVYKEAWSPARALDEMRSWPGHFDEDLLFTFMQSIGIFPPGMLVELRSNRLGLVLASKRRNSLPRALAFYATRERRFIPPELITVGTGLSHDGVIAPACLKDWDLNDIDLSSEEAIRRAAIRHTPDRTIYRTQASGR